MPHEPPSTVGDPTQPVTTFPRRHTVAKGPQSPGGGPCTDPGPNTGFDPSAPGPPAQCARCERRRAHNDRRRPPPPARGRHPPAQRHVFDGERRLDAYAVRVEAGLITAVDRDVTAPAGVPRIDGGGGTLLPGLIDAHVHLAQTAQLDAPRFGVTTLLDMFTHDLALLAGATSDRSRASATTLADVWSAGIGATALGGWPDTGTIPTVGPQTDRPSSSPAG